MKKALFIDCCLRKESRTKLLANEFLNELNGYEIETLSLENENLKPLVGDFLESRQVLLEKNDLNNERFKYAHQFKYADLIIVAAPFWDLSFPALLKIYIENISLEGLTFKTSENGLEGLCKADNLIYLTTRGGFYIEDDPLEQALPYLKALCKFFGIKNFKTVCANGLDIKGYDSKGSLDKAISKAKDLAKTL